MEGRLLYSCAHCADCELRLAGHDVGGLDVPVVHGVFERCTSVGVLVAHVAIEGDFGSSSAMRGAAPVTGTVHRAPLLQINIDFFIFNVNFPWINRNVYEQGVSLL